MRRVERTRKRKRKKIRAILVALFFTSVFVTSFYGLGPYIVKVGWKNTKTGFASAKVQSKQKPDIGSNITVRKFPYPYSSMLALCSDIDDATLDDFKTYHQFLNTKEKTAHGQGIGLDVGDSMWLYMADSYPKTSQGGHGSDKVMTYYKGTSNTLKNDGDEIVHFIRSGWIDSIHTFGDFSDENESRTSFTREYAKSGWKTLKSIGFYPKVWINHGNRANRQNFGAGNTSSFMSYQQGDNPKSIYYHTDITIGNGIRYVWNSWNSNVFGQDYPLTKLKLRDGRSVWGFSRYTNTVQNRKIAWLWDPKELHYELTKSNLDGIVKKKQYSIVAQHLGVKTSDLFTQENLKSLYLLKQYQDDKKVLVANTTRLLNYALAQKYIKYSITQEKGIIYINILNISDPLFGKITPKLDDLRGITFYTENPEKTVLCIKYKSISKNEIQVNPKDETGKVSVSIKWFSPDYTDYTKQ